ncbi:NRDE protein-domain-containing protein, partial [Ochromonadaceae sp. CCMP2298]
MCILFLLVGDGHQRPTVICSNRDEFFDRPTHRGSVQYTNGADTYSPVDVEGGGTWLAFDGLGANALRYAVVLNFHHWREHNLADEPQRRYWTKNNCSPLSLRSRGLLPKDFISKAVLSAQAYAREIFEERLLYRPFNLVLGDASGTYYVSSSSQQQAPLRLLPGRLYAISNGYITDAWQRTTVGRGLVAAVLQRAPQKGEEEYDGDEQETGGEVDAFSTRVALSLDEGADLVPLLLDVLADITPLPDPVFHRSNQAAERMSAVCVSPVIIVRGLPGALWMSMAASLLLELCSLLTGESHFFRPGGRAAVWTWGTAFTFLRSVLVAALIQSRFLPAKDE